MPLNKKDQQRIVWSLFTSQSLFSAGLIAALTLSAIIAADLSGNESVAGLPAALILVGRAALAYPAGWMLDRIGRRLGLSIGYVAGALALFFSAWAIYQGSFGGFLSGILLFGGSRAASEQSRYVAAEIFPTNQKAKAIGTIVFAGTIGAVVGPLLVQPSASFSEAQGFGAESGPYFVAGFLLLIAALVVFLLVRPDPLLIGRELDSLDVGKVPLDADGNDSRNLQDIFREPMALLAVGSMVIGQVVMVLLMVITPLHMDHQEHGTQTISMVIMAHTVGMFALSGVTGRLIDRSGRRVVIAAGSVILILACLLAPVVSSVFLLAIALFLLGFGWNLCFIAGSSLLTNQLTANERGRGQGAGEMAVALGAGIGSLSSGFIFAQASMLALSIVGLALALGLLIWSLWLLSPKHRVQNLPTATD